MYSYLSVCIQTLEYILTPIHMYNIHTSNINLSFKQIIVLSLKPVTLRFFLSLPFFNQWCTSSHFIFPCLSALSPALMVLLLQRLHCVNALSPITHIFCDSKPLSILETFKNESGQDKFTMRSVLAGH